MKMVTQTYAMIKSLRYFVKQEEEIIPYLFKCCRLGYLDADERDAMSLLLS